MGRPKKVKRAYHRKEAQQTEEQVTPIKEVEVTPVGDEPGIDSSDITLDEVDVFVEDMGQPAYELKKLNPKMIIAVKEEKQLPLPFEKADEGLSQTSKSEKQHQMFHSLAQGQIEFEETERLKREATKKQETDTAAQAKNSGKPKLTCPFCQHVQASLNSKDSTSAWCEVCGRCFQANWR